MDTFVRGSSVSWQRVRGHDALIAAFDRAVRRGRLAHAYLFTGPPGVGKRLFAIELAKALLCENPPPHPTLSPSTGGEGDNDKPSPPAVGGEGRVRGKLEACDHCAACTQVEAGTHPDFLVVSRPEEKLEFPIEVMREVCRNFSLKSARGRGKVALLDDVDDLNEESANCFLKTLEEPPPRSVLFLIGTDADR